MSMKDCFHSTTSSYDGAQALARHKHPLAHDARPARRRGTPAPSRDRSRRRCPGLHQRNRGLRDRFRSGAKPSLARERAYGGLQQIVEVLPIDEAVTPHYARIRDHLERQGTPIGPNDLLIAAHAAALDATLVTDNEREFLRVPGLQIENWLRDATALS